MKRREFITILGGAAVAWPLAARAQQPAKTYRIGMSRPYHRRSTPRNLTPSERVCGNSVTLKDRSINEYRSADGQAERFPDLAAELVRLGVDLIVTRGTPATIAARNATGTIPVVMASIGEPLLVVDTLARPGKNVTGLSAFINVMTSKRLELAKEWFRQYHELRCFII